MELCCPTADEQGRFRPGALAGVDDARFNGAATVTVGNGAEDERLVVSFSKFSDDDTVLAFR